MNKPKKSHPAKPQAGTQPQPRMVRHALIATLLGLVVCAITLFGILQKLPLPPQAVPALADRVAITDIALYMRGSDRSVLSSALLNGRITLPEADIGQGAGRYELAVLKAEPARQWILQFTPQDPTARPVMVFSDQSLSGSLIRHPRQSDIQTLAETSEFRRAMDADAATAWFIGTSWIDAGQSEAGDITRALLAPYSHIAASMNRAGSGTVVLLRRERAQPPSALISDWTPAPPAPSILIEDAAFAGRIGALLEGLATENGGLGEGLHGIAMQLWQDRFGTHLPLAGTLAPLLAKPVRLELQPGAATGSISFALQGTGDARILDRLLEEETSRASTVRVRELPLDTVVRRDVIVDTEGVQKTTEDIDGWIIKTVSSAAAGRTLVTAIRGNRYVLANDRTMIDRAIGRNTVAPLPRAHMRGAVDLQTWKSLLNEYAPFLSADPAPMPWSLLAGTSSVEWMLTEEADMVRVKWEMR